MTKQDKKWQAEGDAHTMASAVAITADPKRLKAAQAAAKSLAGEADEDAKRAQDRAKGMRALAKKKAAKKLKPKK
jgi:hypothetical protein